MEKGDEVQGAEEALAKIGHRWLGLSYPYLHCGISRPS